MSSSSSSAIVLARLGYREELGAGAEGEVVLPTAESAILEA